jgi:3-deoxy-D-manno-octulosonic-acid transferase
LDPALREFVAASDTLIAGSTGPGEEEQVIEAYLSLRDRFTRLRLVLAPRHLERLGEVEQLLDARGLSYVKATGLKLGKRADAARILLLDTLGDLRMLYRYGTLAFIGGSLYRGRGGQNLGEPAAAGIAVLFGPFHENQLETARALLAHGGGVVVRDGEELARAVSRLLGDEPLRRQQGARAREVYQNLAGGAARSLAQIRALIGST